MRALIQRVSRARVSVGGESIASIGTGLVILLGVGPDDSAEQAGYLARKIAHLRIFEDDEGKTNRSVLDVGGQAIVVSQFTLYADTQKGRRPSFIRAAHPDIAQPLVREFANILAGQGVPAQTGRFGSEMDVELVNHGPMTIWVERD